MKGTVVFITTTCLLASVLCVRINPNASGRRKQPPKYISQEVIHAISGKAPAVGVDLCKPCIDLIDNLINQLLNILLNAGVVDTCGYLCELLEEETHSQALEFACDIICDVEGIREFIKLINRGDINDIYYCEVMKQCPIFDDGDCKITSFSVAPQSGPQGEFDIAFEYVSKNGTGTGEIDLFIDTVDHLPVGQDFLHELAGPGTYDGGFKLKAVPDPDCDPTQQECEQWLPGVYTVHFAICNGKCGSKHPHSKIYDQVQANFTITG